MDPYQTVLIETSHLHTLALFVNIQTLFLE